MLWLLNAAFYFYRTTVCIKCITSIAKMYIFNNKWRGRGLWVWLGAWSGFPSFFVSSRSHHKLILFIQQGCIKSIKSDSKHFYTVTKKSNECCLFDFFFFYIKKSWKNHIKISTKISNSGNLSSKAVFNIKKWFLNDCDTEVRAEENSALPSQ